MLHVWGCGRFGQHGKGTRNNVSPEEGTLEDLKNETVKLIGCGASHTIVLTENQKLHGWGNNSNGQLGYKCKKEDQKYRTPQIIVTDISNIVGIACGSQHSYIWTQDGTCIRFGEDYVKDLKQNHSFRFKWVESLDKERWILKGCNVMEVACGTRHALIRIDNGSVFSCGANNRGQLGTVDRTATNTPRKVTRIPNSVKQVACGSFHSLCLTDEEDIYQWGYGPACGYDKDIFTPVIVVGDEFEKIKKIAAGDSHSLALSTDGTIFAWGSNNKGQFGKGLGDALEESPVNLNRLLSIESCVDIACFDDTTVAVLQNGSLLFWGNNMWDVVTGGTSMNSFIRTPFELKLGAGEIYKVAIGSWHVAVVVKCSVTQEKSEEVKENMAFMNKDEVVSKEGMDIAGQSETPSDIQDVLGNSRKKKRTSWGRKKIGTYQENSVSYDMNGNAKLEDVESGPIEKDPEKNCKNESHLEVRSSLKATDSAHKNSNKNANLDFAIECVQRENTLTFAPLKATKSHSMASFYIRRPETGMNNQRNAGKGMAKQQRRSYAGMQRPVYNAERSRYSYSAGEKYGRSWTRVSGSAEMAEAETLGNCSMPTWNIESLLDMTTKSNDKNALVEQRATKDGFYKDRSHDYRIASEKSRSLNDIAVSYSLQTLELSKLRGQGDWKRNRYVRGLMKN